MRVTMNSKLKTRYLYLKDPPEWVHSQYYCQIEILSSTVHCYYLHYKRIYLEYH